LAWTIEYADTAKGQLRKLDKQVARRIVDFMDERVAGLENPRNTGKALVGPHGGSGAIGWAIAG
jgi:mRNA interferase RelE/StbE